MKRIQKEAGTKDLRFAPEDVLAENLKVIQGAVTPFALVNNVEKHNVIVLLDKNLTDCGCPFVLHPCRNDKSCLVTFPQLEQFLNKLGYTYKLVDFGAEAAPAEPAKKQPAEKKAPAEKKSQAAAVEEKGETKLGIQNTIESNFSSWYTEVITKAEMIEYYDVSGCYIIRPWGYYVWKTIQQHFGRYIERMGVEDCYFPLFVSKNCLEREKDHIEGFAPEVAWVTKAGDSDLEQPVGIRPTSETVMYPYYGKWIRSHRDLPLRLNQWNNVIRWEFSHPTPFIRTREFLWQEGHCVWPTEQQCTEEVLEILDGYAEVYEKLLAVPVVKGRKTEKEKFAGAYFTTTVETFIGSVGRGCQGGTSHNLGQNFAKMFDINIQDPENNDKTIIPFQNSWGLSTRTIGVMVMVHGDNKGLVMPPRVSQVQVVIIPVGITKSTTEEERQTLLQEAQRLEKELNKADIRAKADLRDNYSPGWRFNHWEVKGTPLRIELGPKELQEKQLAIAVRYNGERRTVAWDGNVTKSLATLLEEVHDGMFEKARQTRLTHTKRVTDWGDFTATLNQKCILLSPWCGEMSCEDNIKTFSAEESKAAQSEEVREDARAPSMGAKSLCIPFEQPEGVEGLTCVCKGCTNPAKQWVLWGRSY
ncbi:prolyl-tRNA synthetase [Angomonas deanei]|nr:prolyl-tRNA synthetase [Angomonas deanei]|eukprot:EPY35310.1 prolyl-tRNA synthetase [Angomonas deanei]